MRTVAIGDDCMLSSGIWIRNYDMHTIFSLDDSSIINAEPVDTIIERHVWLGQDVLLLSTTRIGFGSVVGARSVLRGEAPPRALLVGTPARVVRTNIGWSRPARAVTRADRQIYATLSSIDLPA